MYGLIKLDIQANTTEVPVNIYPYWECEKSVPGDLDFYKGMTITGVCIRIFRDRFLDCENPSNNVKYQVQQSCVILQASEYNKRYQFKVGLHLFPVLRFKKTQMPEEMKLYLKDNNGNKITIDLPPNMMTNLLRYLNDGRPNHDFTCMQFADFLKGVYEDSPDTLDLEKYTLSPCFREKLLPGDLVIFKDEDYNPLHAAIYLRDNLYLWHCSSICLRVSTYEDILTCYSAKSAQIAHL